LELKPFNISVVKVRPGQFSTEIQKDWTDNLVKNFAGAPNQIRELYGGDDFEETVKTTIQSLSKGTAPPEPMIVVNALMDMISTKQTKLEPYYWLGQDAHTLWRALHALPTTVADSIKGVMQFHPIKQTLPPTGVISHVTIRVRSIETSLPFYKAFGLELYGNTEDGKQFLRSASSSKEPNWSTLILLQEDASMPTRGKSWDTGMTRLCMYTTNLSAEVQRLSNLGLKPMAPPADDGTAKIAAYYDPDNFIVYLIEFKKTLGLLVRANLWWNKRVSPSLFHWTINVADAENANQVFEKLGFKSLSDQTRDQVSQDLLPAFKISSDTTIIEHIRLCKLPQDAFIATIMQWVSPKSEGAELYNSMTVSVTDVDAALEQAREAGMSITEPVEYRRLPVFGGVLVGTAFVESSSRVEFCCFTHKR
jgi:predicted lactoylglutathione lyase